MPFFGQEIFLDAAKTRGLDDPAYKAAREKSLRLIDKRIAVINMAIFLCVASALATCFVVALMFFSRLFGLHVGAIVAVAFVVSMLLLMTGLVYFLIEVRMSLGAIHVRAELLELDSK